jgi:hypothetical protein
MSKNNCVELRMFVWVSVLILLLTVIPVRAQLPTGTILGVVKDSSGGVVPGVAVTVQNAETGFTRTVTTGDDGAYRFPALPVGRYDVKVERTGFKTETHAGLTLEVMQEAVVNFTLQVGTSEQQVLITGEAPLVNTTTSSLGGLVNEQKMEDLPLNGRNYIDLTLLQAGVAKATELGGYIRIPTEPRPRCPKFLRLRIPAWAGKPQRWAAPAGIPA